MKIKITFNSKEREAFEKLIETPFENRDMNEKYGDGTLTMIDNDGAVADVDLNTEFVVDVCSKLSEITKIGSNLILTCKAMFKDLCNKWETNHEYKIYEKYSNYKYAIKTDDGENVEIHFAIDDEELCKYIKSCTYNGITMVSIEKVSDYLENNK